MAIIDVNFRTMTCDGQCGKTVTFDMKEAQQIPSKEGNEWLRAGRVINRGDGKMFFYCSDECEVAGVSAGDHNTPEPKKIVESSGGDAAIKLAAEAAKAAEEATKNIKAGKPTKLQVIK